VPEDAVSEPQSREGDKGEVSMSAISSRPQSISSSSMGTSKGCQSGLTGILTEGSMSISDDLFALLAPSPAIHTDNGREDVTSFVISTADGRMGDESVTEDRCDVEETAMALVVPFGVVRVKTPGITHLREGRPFGGDLLSSLVNSFVSMTSGDVDDAGVTLKSSTGKGTRLICLWSQRAALPTSMLRPRRLASLQAWYVGLRFTRLRAATW